MIRTERLISLVRQLDKLYPEGYRIHSTDLSKMPGIAIISVKNNKVIYDLTETKEGHLLLQVAG